MRHIRKQREPGALTLYRSSDKHATYDGMPAGLKPTIRKALLKEQHSLCAYCTRAISSNSVRIEHWATQRDHPDLALDWQNLLAACDGGGRSPASGHHCDVSRGNRPLRIRPTEQPERHLGYGLASGEVSGKTPDVDQDVCVTLRLNVSSLVEARKAALQGVLESLRRSGTTTAWSVERLERCRAHWTSPSRPHSGFVLDWLEKRLRQRRP